MVALTCTLVLEMFAGIIFVISQNFSNFLNNASFKNAVVFSNKLELEMHYRTRVNVRRESATCFKRPAEQVLALATEPRAKQEVRSVLCHICQ